MPIRPDPTTSHDACAVIGCDSTHSNVNHDIADVDDIPLASRDPYQNDSNESESSGGPQQHAAPEVIDVPVEEPTEAPRIRTIKSPGQPSKKEIEEHNITHNPYRSWCPHCVRGRGRSSPHSQTAPDDYSSENSIPIVSLSGPPKKSHDTNKSKENLFGGHGADTPSIFRQE